MHELLNGLLVVAVVVFVIVRRFTARRVDESRLFILGVKTGSGAILLSVAAWMLTQNAVLVWRARTLPARVSVQP
jgi:hypothetical protein